jgi:type VI secretion system secreted protein VgrG
MSLLASNQPRYFFETPALAPDALPVVDFAGQESLSQLFRFDLNLVSQDPEINFAEVIQKPATLTMMRDDVPVKIHGLIADFEQGDYTADWVAYRATLVPRAWLLSLNYQSRVFQNMTVEAIVTQVLKEAGFAADDFRFALSGSYKPREYCVQYRETDLNFISRLLEFEGICFFFEHGDERETLVMTDDRSEHPLIDGESSVSYHAGAGLLPHQNAETVRQLVCREKIVTGKVVLKDYNYRTPETMLRAESQLNHDMPGMYYEYGQHFKDNAEGARLAKVRNEEIECMRRVMTGQSNCVGLRSGFRFSLQNHYRSDLNGDYLLTQISHFGSQGAALATPMGNTEAPTYRNEFTCIPAEVQYRPPRLTPEPRIPGIMTAKIETAGGDYAHIDEMGRYKVKMPFDLSDRNNAMASRALRMAQPYSGANYGIHFPNRANSEMVWACIDGNVDRPLGLSTVPNPSNTSPSVAGNKAQCVIRTAGQNELTLDDTIGSENIYLHATKDQTIQINNDKNQTVGNNETLEVGTNRTKSIGNDETLSIGNNRSKTVGADQFEKIGKNNALDVGVNYEESIGSNKSVTVGANQDVSIGKNKKEKIGGSMIQKVTRAKIENVGMAKMLSIGGAYQMTVGAVMNETVAISRTEQVGMTKTAMVGKNSIEKIGKTKTINAGEKIELVCGEGKIVIEKSGKIEIVGKELHLSATGPVKINGKIVDIN